MSFWVELHCDYRRRGRAADGRRHGCASMSTDVYGHMAPRLSAIPAITSLLNKEAKTNGWKKTREGWACPYCRSRISPAPARTEDR